MLNPIEHVGLSSSSQGPPVIDDGVIKFKLTLKKAAPLQADEVLPLEKWRAILWRLGLIGEYPIEKIGYGNISQRLPNPKNAFVISGTQTGQLPHLRREHYSRVMSCDLQKNAVHAEGPIAPSSESLTHYGIYESNPQITAIFHVHHAVLWERMIEKAEPSISADIPYGTKEMAEASKSLIAGSDQGLFVMKGHQDGIIAYGPSTEVAGRLLLKLYKELGPITDL